MSTEDQSDDDQPVTHLQEQVVEVLQPYVGDQAPELAARITGVVRSERFIGPIPHPRHLAEYERVLPGSADRLMTMAEKDQNHRHACDNTIIKAETDFMSRGQIFAMAALVLMLIFTAVFVLTGHEVAGGLVGGATLISVVLAFLNRRQGKPTDSPPSPTAPDEAS